MERSLLQYLALGLAVYAAPQWVVEKSMQVSSSGTTDLHALVRC